MDPAAKLLRQVPCPEDIKSLRDDITGIATETGDGRLIKIHQCRRKADDLWHRMGDVVEILKHLAAENVGESSSLEMGTKFQGQLAAEEPGSDQGQMNILAGVGELSDVVAENEGDDDPGGKSDGCTQVTVTEKVEGNARRGIKRPHSPFSSDDGMNSTADEMSPMMNPVVLEIFFRVCDLRDLRRFRLVCKSWRDLSLQRWRDEMIVIIGSDKYFAQVQANPKARLMRRRLHWKDLNILYQAPSISAKPFRNYMICNWGFPTKTASGDGLNTHEKRRNVRSFWRNWGPSMRKLHLDAPCIESSESFRRTIVEGTPNLEPLKLTEMDAFSLGDTSDFEDEVAGNRQANLKSLSISLKDNIHENADDKEIPWLGMFRSFPNLENRCSTTVCQDKIKETSK